MKEEKTTLIKPKKKKEKEEEKLKILGPILMLVLGIILLTNSSQAVIVVFYCIGAVFILVGVYNLIKYYQMKKDLNIEDNNKLVLGSTAIFIGILVLLLSGAIETFLRFIVGIILIYNGLKNTIVSLNFKNYFTMIIGIVLIGMGLYTIFAENIIFQIIGVLLIISSVVDFIGLLSTKSQKK